MLPRPAGRPAGRDRCLADRAGANVGPAAPHHVAVIGDRVAIADSTNGRLILLDRRTRQVVAQVDVGAAPHSVAAVVEGPPA
jgi:YVTN family beta-propeller protein